MAGRASGSSSGWQDSVLSEVEGRGAVDHSALQRSRSSYAVSLRDYRIIRFPRWWVDNRGTMMIRFARAPRKPYEAKQRRFRIHAVWCAVARFWQNRLVARLKMTDLQFIPDLLARTGLLSALRAFKKGDFSVRLPMDLIGIDGEIAHAFNEVVEVNEKMTDEFARIRDEVGREGQINQRVSLPAATGSWADCVDSVNTLIGDLIRPTSEVARVIESVARGDLSQRMLIEIDGRPLRGEFLRIGKVVNTMVDQLGGFAPGVARGGREGGTDVGGGGQGRGGARGGD